MRLQEYLAGSLPSASGLAPYGIEGQRNPGGSIRTAPEGLDLKDNGAQSLEAIMGRFLSVPFIAVSLVASLAWADQNPAVEKAQAAAKAWLALTDGGSYAQSWDEAAAGFKAAVTRPGWEAALNAVRSPLGAVQNRKLKSATCTRTLPGAPDGEYVVIQFETRFEHKPAALETLTPAHGPDGSWRVSGYYIR